MKRKRKPFGFTLIEMLIAMTIVSFLGAVVYNTFSQGLKIWHRASQEKPEIDVEIFFEKLSRDFGNAFTYKDIEIQGQSASVTFFSMASGIDSASKQLPVRLRYIWDQKKGTVNRVEESYQQVLYPSKEKSVPRPLVRGVRQCELEYYYYDEGREVYRWTDEWKNACLPLAVKISVLLGENLKTRTLTKYIPIPAGGCRT